MKHSQKNKTTLVFLPGWGFKASIWHFIKKWLNEYNLVFLDLPLIAEENVNFNFDKHIMHTLEKKIPPHSVLIGWSLGGLIALNIAMNYPNKCQKLIMVCSTPKFTATDNWLGISAITTETFLIKARTQLQQLIKKFNQWVLYPFFNQDLLVKLKKHQINEPTAIKSLLFYLDFLFQKDLRYYHQQIVTRHILGEKDSILPSSITPHLIENNPHTIIKIIENSGHIPFLTHTEIFIKYLKELLNEG